MKLTWPFTHIHVLQGIQASCLSDVSLALAVQDVPSEALAFSLFINKMGRGRLQTKLKAGSIPMATFSPFENVAGRLGDPRGNSRWFSFGLVWVKRRDVSGRRP